MAPDIFRTPRAQLLLNGVAVPNVLSISVQSNVYFAADRFTVQVAANASPPAAGSLPVTAEIRMSCGGENSTLIVGDIDQIEIDPLRGFMNLHGRDFIGRLIDAQISETFENQSVAQIVNAIAARHGLITNMNQAGSLVGRYYQDSHTKTSLLQHSKLSSDWDFLVAVCQEYGLIAWMEGYTLFLQDAQAEAQTVEIDVSACIGVSASRDLRLAGGATVQVKSWASQSQTSIVGTSTVAATTNGLTLAAVRPNLSQAGAAAMANSLAKQWSLHTSELTLEMPGELTINPGMNLSFSGTSTDIDAVYEVMEVERRFSMQEGFIEAIVARAQWMPSSTV